MDDWKALPRSRWLRPDVHRRVQHTMFVKMTSHGSDCLDESIVVHVNQHLERPGDVECPAEIEVSESLAVDELRMLVGQTALHEFPSPLVQDGTANLDAGVVPTLEIVDERDATAKGAAAEIKKRVARREADLPQKGDLEPALHLPQIGRADQAVSDG